MNGAPDDDTRTLARFAAHQRAWQQNEALRALYASWYAKVRAALPDRALGRFVELGSGPGFAKHFIPELELSDVVKAPWHEHRISAEELPFPDQSLGALVLFDVLHHLPSPTVFMAEASRALKPGGRVVLCEPYLSALSYPVYRFFHEEGADPSVDPFSTLAGESNRDPFDGNQAVPTLMLVRGRAELERRFPALRVVSVERFAGPSYVASGGFSRRPLLPMVLWRALVAAEERLPAAAYRLLGFRLLAVLERR